MKKQNVVFIGKLTREQVSREKKRPLSSNVSNHYRFLVTYYEVDIFPFFL